jgi:predicted HTH domain antitoxin
MTITLPSGFRAGSPVSQADLLKELAIVLYEREKLSLGRAARLAGMEKWAFNHLLADREVPMHYDEADLRHDLDTLESLFGR